MADGKKTRTRSPSLDERFTFLGDAVAPGDQAALKPALYEVEDRVTGAARSLKLWRKTGTPIDDDLRGLWRHEMRQVQRVMSYAGARDVIVDVVEFVEDADFFGVLLESAGHPLSAKKLKVKRRHWLYDLKATRARTLLWKNIRRIAAGLGIVHAQGLVHGTISGEFYPSRDVTIMGQYKLDLERQHGAEIRMIGVEGGGPSMSHEANLRRLSDIAATGWNEEIAMIDGRTVDLRDDEFMIVRVVDGMPRGLPETAGASLRHVVAEAAALAPGTGDLMVGYAGRQGEPDVSSVSRACAFDPDDLVIGGTEQRTLFLDLLQKVQRRMIIHSTFLDVRRFEALLGPIRAACESGVTIDLLWGAEKDEETEQRNASAAAAIARLVREDASTRGRVRVHMRSTGSHAKLVFLDTEEGWLAAVGSCNWMSSPFQSVELSVVIRDSAVLSDVATALQRLGGRRGLADSIASEMALTARDLRRMPSAGGPARMGVVVGEVHDEMMRTASAAAAHMFFVGCHRLGSTARPGALLQGGVAARRPGVAATILYTQPSGPLKNRHARALRDDAAANGVNLIKTGKIPLHGKIVAWGEDDVVVTSLNWASAAADPDFPWADIGIHINAPGLAASTMAKLRKLFPELLEGRAAEQGAAARAVP